MTQLELQVYPGI